MPHSFAFCTILSAWACSSSALVGMHPQIRQVPPSAFWRSITATFFPSCEARMAATYPPVPAPMTTTSYELANSKDSVSTLERRERDEGVGRAGPLGCRRRRGLARQMLHVPAQLSVLVFQFPVHLQQ